MKSLLSKQCQVTRVLMLALSLSGAFLANPGCTRQQEAPALPHEVQVSEAALHDVPIMMEVVGQTSGSRDVEIRARVEGYLMSVNFREGEFVEQGALLYTIDPREYEAAVAQKQADVETNRAKLVQAEQEVTRLKPLAAEQAVSQRDYDNAVSSRDAAKAQLDAAKAALEKARLDLSYTSILAPLSGLADVTQVKPGNLVGRGQSTLLTTISATDPIFFTGSVTEADYLRLVDTYLKKQADPKGDQGKQGIELVLANGDLYSEKGQVDAVQRAIDTKTGTLAVRLKFPNPHRLLRPGQYGRVRFVVDTLKDAVCVPRKAVQELQGVQQVVVVSPAKKTEIRTIETGPKLGDLVSVTSGLKAGEPVIVEGLQRTQSGLDVRTKPYVPEAPSNESSKEPGKPEN